MTYALFAIGIIVLVATLYLIEAVRDAARMVGTNIRELHQALAVFAGEMKTRLPITPVTPDQMADNLDRIKEILENISKEMAVLTRDLQPPNMAELKDISEFLSRMEESVSDIATRIASRVILPSEVDEFSDKI